MKKRTLLVLSLVLFLAISLALIPRTSVHAAELAGVTMPENRTIGGKAVSLVGMGIRTKTFLKIKVYVFGLYMEEPSLDPARIIDSNQVKGIFIHGIGPTMKPKAIQEAWRKGFDDNTPERTQDLSVRMDQLIGLFTESAKKGDSFSFTYIPDRGTTTIIKDKDSGTIPGDDLMKALMAIWFGEKPADEGLKESVLKGLK